MRKTYVFDKKLGKMVPKGTEHRENKSSYVMPDIEPYQVVGPEFGKVISSRSQHREYLRKHNLTEVGDQKAYITGEKK